MPAPAFLPTAHASPKPPVSLHKFGDDIVDVPGAFLGCCGCLPSLFNLQPMIPRCPLFPSMHSRTMLLMFLALPGDAADACPLFPTYSPYTALTLGPCGIPGASQSTQSAGIQVHMAVAKDRRKAVLGNDSSNENVFQMLFNLRLRNYMRSRLGMARNEKQPFGWITWQLLFVLFTAVLGEFAS